MSENGDQPARPVARQASHRAVRMAERHIVSAFDALRADSGLSAEEKVSGQVQAAVWLALGSMCVAKALECYATPRLSLFLQTFATGDLLNPDAPIGPPAPQQPTRPSPIVLPGDPRWNG